MKTTVIFGGTGFIGSHLALHLLSINYCDKVILADIKPIRKDFNLSDARIKYIELDVRKPISDWNIPKSNIQLIANFAAVHREPGHQRHEYFETNIPGAEHVCDWAELVGCNDIIFTSSIAPYGPTEKMKNELSTPAPTSAYGESKLAAEKIHENWQRSSANRRLVIVRPGVMFGPGEGGNVTRLIQATMRHYFFYMGNQQTRKAGGYVKELVMSMMWALNKIGDEGQYLYNFTFQNPPTIKEYVDAACKVKGVKRLVPNLPFKLLLSIAYTIDWLAKPFGIKQPISPVRIKKLSKSNNIEPLKLKQDHYQYHYTLETAFEDWLADRPDEWK